MNVVIMGPPGVGKGTQSWRILSDLGLVHISTGDMLRIAIRSGSDLGLKVKSVMAEGDLVLDALVMEMIRDRFKQPDAAGGWLLDGFPRTLVQADGMNKMLTEVGQTIDVVLALDVPDDEIVRRLTGRYTCRKCNAITSREQLNEDNPTKCANCGQDALYQRGDDREETIRRRLQVFRDRTWPCTDRLGESFPLHRINGLGTPDEVAQRIASVLE